MALPSYGVNATASIVNAPPGSVPVTTFHNDDVRDGANLNESALNTSNVNPQSFGKLAALPVDGQVYAQPLYLPNINIGGVMHNLVFVATENDTVYAYDADGLSDSAMWKQHLATPLSIHDQEGIEPLLGITSTPVIDTSTGTIYVLTDGQENGSKVFRLHALDITSGSEKFGGPAIVTGTVPGTGYDSVNGQITLETNCYQRNGLALDPATNAIYITFGHCSHGWVLAYDKATLQQTAIMNDTADGGGGGLWGGTPAIDDSSGDLYLITGVDIGDPAPDYNDSALRLQASDLSILDYFKPSNEAYLRLAARNGVSRRRDSRAPGAASRPRDRARAHGRPRGRRRFGPLRASRRAPQRAFGERARGVHARSRVARARPAARAAGRFRALPRRERPRFHDPADREPARTGASCWACAATR